MILSITNEELTRYVNTQVNTFIPDGKNVLIETKIIENTLQRLDYCFSHVSLGHYFDGKVTKFNHLFSDHYVMFLWFLSNEVYNNYGKGEIPDKLYYLNKILHGLDCMYDTKMPEIFLLFHGVGTMLGKATYSDFFISLHGCTIGSHKGKYPVMGKGVSLTASSSIIGNCTIGRNVSISAYTNVFEKDIQDNSTVFINSTTGILEIKSSKKSYAQQFFNVDLDEV